MGKLRKMRKKARIQPTGFPSGAEAIEERESVLDAVDSSSGHYHLIEMLSSPSAEDRQCACAGLANLVLDLEAEIVPILLDKGVVKSLASMLVDECEALRLGAAGALRNLTIAGHETCVRMVEDDVMTSLVVFFKRSLESVMISDAAPIDETCLDQIEQGLHLLWNLSECSTTVVKIFNSENLLPLIFYCISPKRFSSLIAVTAAQCLHTVTEENPPLCETIVGSGEMLTALERLLLCDGDAVSVHRMMLCVLTAGILFNVHGHMSPVARGKAMQAIARALAKALDVDVPARMKAIGPDLVAADAGAMEEAEKYQERKESDQVLDIRIALAAQQLALEILANLCCNDDSSDDGGSFPSESDSEVDGVEEEQSGSGFESMALSMSVDSVEAVVSHCLPEKTLGKCRFADPAVYELLGAHKLGQTLVQKLNTVQSRALVALHNMLSVLDSDELSRPDSLDSLWPSLFNLATGVSEKGPSRSDEEFLEAVTGVMRSLAKRLQSTGHKCVEPEQIIRIASVCPTVAFPSVRANVVGLLGVLGTSLAQRPDAAELLTVVGSALCKAVSSDTDLWVVVEALDAIFDVFGGDGDIVLPTVKFLGLLPQLERVASGLKKRIASKKKSLGARLPVAENAWTNLPRFITYLRKGIKYTVRWTVSI
ncbi:HEAT repeat-containing protein 3-like [Oscarella lobularis]|uniref:HEAT repeat-containing protein 3-like n=1 Tax=Oscarella lobularis TaxID=121494 RepID=UPI0033142DA8